MIMINIWVYEEVADRTLNVQPFKAQYKMNVP